MKVRLIIPAFMALAAGLCLAQTPAQTPAETEGAAVRAPVLTPPAATTVTPAPATEAPKGPVVVETPAETKPAAAAVTAAPDPALQPAPTKLPATASAPPAPKPTPLGADGKPYVIGSTDVLYIRVWNNANLTGMVDVRPDGLISLALVGEVKADGLTVEQLTQLLKSKLGEFLINPEVDIQVTKINSKKFMVVGAVSRAGDYPLVGKVTIFEALTNAGILETAKQNKVYLLRGKEQHNFQYKDALKGKNKDPDLTIEDGDRIIVPQ